MKKMTSTITNPTKGMVFTFWTTTELANPEAYTDSAGDRNLTMMGEDAADHFGISSTFGDTEIERAIFDWALDYDQANQLNQTI